MKKKLVIVSIILVSVLLIMILVLNNNKEQDMVEELFHESSENEQKYLNNLVAEDGREVEKDGYVFTLVREFYDNVTNTGFFELEISHGNKKIDCDISKTNKIWIDNRFELIAHRIDEIKKVEKGKEIILYVSITNASKLSDGKLSILDNEGHNNDVKDIYKKIGEFDFIKTNKHITFKLDNEGKIYISPISAIEILNFGTENDTIKEFIINFDDGKKISLLKNGDTQYSNVGILRENGNEKTINEYLFRKIMNVDNIKSITIDGKNLYAVE